MAVRLIAYAACLLATPLGAAETLPDPTRPPPGIDTVLAAPVGSGPALQAIRIEGRQRSAVIGGETVRVGSRLGEQRVTRIDHDQVVLVGPAGTQTLKLFPQVEIKRRDPRVQAPRHVAEPKAARKDLP